MQLQGMCFDCLKYGQGECSGACMNDPACELFEMKSQESEEGGFEKMLTETVMANISFYVRKAGMKVGEVERRAGYSKGYFSRVKSGACMLSVDGVERIADVLSVPVTALYDTRKEGWQKRDPWRANCQIYVCPFCGGTCHCCAKSCSYRFCPNCGKEVLKK